MAFSMTIAKRGMRLGIVYVVMGAVLTLFGVALSGIMGVVGRTGQSLPVGVDLNAYLSLIGVSIVCLGGLMAAMPVSLLFVHDKDNGTLEYLLSMGFDQRDIFRAYLTASLVLGAPLILIGGVVAALVDLLVGLGPGLAGAVLVCSLALGLSAIALVTVLMSAFSAFQRQPLGMNQPLGIALGVFVVMGAVLAPMAMPAYQVVLELAISGIVAAVSLLLLALTPRLIRREKMLP